MSNLSVFQFQDQDVRFVGTPEIPEWVAADIVNILYPDAAKNKNHSTYLSKVPTEWKGSTKIATPGGMQSMTTLYESGFYFLIGRSDSSLAIVFQQWMYGELLPAVRKTGKYSVQPEQVEVETEFSQACKKIKQAKEILGISDDDPIYRKSVENLFATLTPDVKPVVVKAKPTVNYSPAPEVVIKAVNTQAFCFVVVADTLIKVRKKGLDRDNYMTVGLLTRWSTKFKNVAKKHPSEVAEAMQILSEAGFLKEVEINCRGAMNYQVVKLPTPSDIKQLTPA